MISRSRSSALIKLPQRNLLWRGDLESLAPLDGRHEGGRLEHAVGCACVEPGVSAADLFTRNSERSR